MRLYNTTIYYFIYNIRAAGAPGQPDAALFSIMLCGHRIREKRRRLNGRNRISKSRTDL